MSRKTNFGTILALLKIGVSFNSDGRVFITEDRLREEIMGSIR